MARASHSHSSGKAVQQIQVLQSTVLAAGLGATGWRTRAHRSERELHDIRTADEFPSLSLIHSLVSCICGGMPVAVHPHLAAKCAGIFTMLPLAWKPCSVTTAVNTSLSCEVWSAQGEALTTCAALMLPALPLCMHPMCGMQGGRYSTAQVNGRTAHPASMSDACRAIPLHCQC